MATSVVDSQVETELNMAVFHYFNGHGLGYGSSMTTHFRKPSHYPDHQLPQLRVHSVVAALPSLIPAPDPPSPTPPPFRTFPVPSPILTTIPPPHSPSLFPCQCTPTPALAKSGLYSCAC